jgi:putative tricarboxylic transport membrane protein
VTRPISGTLIGVAVVLLIVAVLPMIARKRDEVFVEE